MNIVLVMVWFVLFILVGIKIFVDQARLLKLYREEVDPPFPVAPGEKPDLSADPLGLQTAMNMTHATFSKHRDHPRLAVAARKVHLDMLAGAVIGVGGFVLIVLVTLTSK